METVKETTVSVKTTDGKTVELGDTVVFSCSGRELVGKFDGIDKRGNWKFDGIGDFKDVYYAIAPRSIQKMYKANIEIIDDSIPFWDESEGK